MGEKTSLKVPGVWVRGRRSQRPEQRGQKSEVGSQRARVRDKEDWILNFNP